MHAVTDTDQAIEIENRRQDASAMAFLVAMVTVGALAVALFI